MKTLPIFNSFTFSGLTFYSLLLCVFLMSGCSVQLVAPYDARTLAQMENIDKDIDYFYLSLQALPEPERTYEEVATEYLDIEVQIRSLERRQAIREKNQETLTQTETLTSFWQQDIAAHKAKNTLSDFMIKRRMDQYHRLMDALIKGELAKEQ